METPLHRSRGRTGLTDVRELYDILDGAEPTERVDPRFWRSLARQFGEGLYSDILFLLTRLEFEPLLAMRHFEAILDTWRSMSLGLGRDVALATAVCDYFQCERPHYEAPVIVESGRLAQNEEFAYVDALTGLHNRRYFINELKREMARSDRTGKPFTLLLLDIDHFKSFNDEHGHLAGDEALRHVAGILKTTARAEDQVVRFGGEEFAIILPDADVEKAHIAAERHRKSVEESRLSLGGRDFGSLTISIGAAGYPTDARHDAGLVSVADRALYAAKDAGRNRICMSAPDSRRFPRFPLRLPASCIAGDRPSPLEGHTINISLAGMLFETTDPLEPGQNVDAELRDGETPQQLRLAAQSVHRHRDENGDPVYRIGMAFRDAQDTENLMAQGLRELISRKSGF